MKNLQQRAQHAWSINHQREEREKLEKEQKEEEEKQQLLSAFQGFIGQEFETSILEETQGTYEIVRHLGATQPVFLFKYEGLQWRICKQSSRNWEDPWVWDIWAAYNDQHRPWSHGTIAQGKLQSALLIELGKRFTEQEKIRQQQAEDLRRGEENAAKFQEEEELRQQENLKVLQQADEISARLQSFVEKEKQRVLEKTWQWPVGVSITIWYITFATGEAHNEDGNLVTEKDGGWVLTDCLDEEGYAVLQPYHEYRYSVHPPQNLKLSDLKYRYWEKFTFSSIKELPASLINPVSIEVPGIGESNYFTDGKTRFVEDEKHIYKEEIGCVPLPWIQKLVGENTCQQ